MSKIIRLRQNFCSSGVRTAVLAAQFSFLLSASKAIGDFNYAKEKVENYEKKISFYENSILFRNKFLTLTGMDRSDA